MTGVDPRRITEFWMQVDRRLPDDCWPWTGYAEDGYGRFFWRGRMVGAHELAVTFTTGESRLAELDTCHSCGNSICCNPAHLRFDTRRSNVGDAVEMGRHHKPEGLLTDEEVRLIRSRRAAGASQKDLAVQFGVSQSFVSMLINGKKRAAAGGPVANNREYRRSA